MSTTTTPVPPVRLPSRKAPDVQRRLVLVWAVYIACVWALAGYSDGRWSGAGAVHGLSRFDGIHYTIIAERGHSADDADRKRLAFFPLYPALARMLGGREHAPLAGILLSQLCLLGSVLVLRQLRDPQGRGLIAEPGFWLMVGPLGFFMAVLYTESLFLLLALAGVLAYRRRLYGAALVALVLCGLTRPTAITVAAYFGYEAWRHARAGRSALPALACIAAIGAGIGGYALYVASVTGELAGYLTVQSLWGHTWVVPFQPVVQDLRATASSLLALELRTPTQIVRLASTLAILALAWWGRHRLDGASMAYLIVSLLFIHAQSPNRASARYELVVWPVWILAAQLAVRRRHVAYVAVAACAIVQALFVRDFVHSVWVA